MAAGRENFIFFLCPLDGVRFRIPLSWLLLFAVQRFHEFENHGFVVTIDEIPIAEQFTLRFIMIKRDLDSLSGRLSHIPHGYGPWRRHLGRGACSEAAFISSGCPSDLRSVAP